MVQLNYAAIVIIDRANELPVKEATFGFLRGEDICASVAILLGFYSDMMAIPLAGHIAGDCAIMK